jgi:hypothetical protein
MFWNFAVRDWVQAGAVDQSTKLQDTMSPLESEVKGEQLSASDEIFEGPTSEVEGSPTVSTPRLGNRREFELKRSNRNMRYNALFDGKATPQHESYANESEVIPPLHPNLKLVTGSLANGSKSSISLVGYVPNNSSQTSLASKGDNIHGHRRSRHRSPTQTSEDLEKSLQQAIAEHYVFQVAMAGMDMGEAYVDLPDLPESASTAAAGSDFHHQMERYGSLPGSALSPGEAQDIDPDHAEEDHGHGDGSPSECLALNFRENDRPAEADTLDEALEMFKTYSHSQQGLHAQFVASEDGTEDGTVVSPSRAGADNKPSSPVSPITPGKKRLPARYHSKRGRKN